MRDRAAFTMRAARLSLISILHTFVCSHSFTAYKEPRRLRHFHQSPSVISAGEGGHQDAAEDYSFTSVLAQQQHPLNSGLGFFWAVALTSYVSTCFLAWLGWVWLTSNQENETEEQSLQPALGDVSSDEDHDSPRTRVSLIAGTPATPSLQKKKLAQEMARHSHIDGWRRSTLAERLRMGAWTLSILCCTMIIYAVMRFWDRPFCAPLLPTFHIPEMLFLACLSASAFMCWKFPNRNLYLFALACFFLYVPLSQLPPFNMSCRVLNACQVEGHWRVSQAVRHADCSLQGQTAQQIFLTVFLMLPWLIIEKRMMFVMLAWVGFVYVLWSVAYFRYSPDGELGFNNLDVMIRSILLFAAFGAAYFKKNILEKAQQNRFISDLARRESSRRLYNILGFMLPVHVIEPMLCNPGGAIATSIEKVTILFIVIDDFDSIVQSRSPQKLLLFLNKYYTKMDEICKLKCVTKIETVGEEYVCCVGVTPEDIEESSESDHSVILQRLFDAATSIMELQSSILKFKMGMHTGEVRAGVIGHKLPRYRLFGDTINTAARMMQKGAVGKLQFGKQTYESLPEDILELIEPRGKVEMKGKGQVDTFLFSGYPAPAEDAGTDENDSSGATERSKRKRVTIGATLSIPIEAQNLLTDHSSSFVEETTMGGLLKYLLKPGRQEEEGEESSSRLRKRSINSRLGSVSVDFGDVVEKMKQHETTRSNRWILSEKDGYMEEEWQHEFHQTFCKKMVPRLDKWIFGLALISLVELLWNTPNPHHPEQGGWASEHDWFGSWEVRVPLFICTRMLIIGVVAFLRMRVMSELKENSSIPESFQILHVAVMWIVGLLLFFSYDVMIVNETVEHKDKFIAPIDQVFSLYFVLLFFLVIRQRMQFYHSLAFLPLALVIVFCTNVHNSGVYFPFIGQVLFVVIAISNSVLTHYEEQCDRSKFKARTAVDATKDRVTHVLNSMMPSLVMEEIRRSPSSALPNHSYEAATIAQSDLCGFTKLASTLTPIEVVQCVSELFGKFDDLTDDYGIYKIETIGDAYIAGQAEKPLTTQNSPTDVIRFGCEMVNVVKLWAEGRNLKEIACRVGVHYGSCLGGIVGTDMQRYHIFGALMQGLEIMESTSKPSRVQISRACYDAVVREWGDNVPAISFKEREEEFLTTSKEEVHHYDEVGGRTFLVEE